MQAVSLSSRSAWLGQTLNFVQISNGQAAPLGPGLQTGKYQNYFHVQSGEYWTYLMNTKHTLKEQIIHDFRQTSIQSKTLLSY